MQLLELLAIAIETSEADPQRHRQSHHARLPHPDLLQIRTCPHPFPRLKHSQLWRRQFAFDFNTNPRLPQIVLCVLALATTTSALPISASGPHSSLARTEFPKWKVETEGQVMHIVLHVVLDTFAFQLTSTSGARFCRRHSRRYHLHVSRKLLSYELYNRGCKF